MKKRIQTLIILLSLVTIITGCVHKNQSSAKATIKESFTMSDTYDYKVEENSKGMKLRINLLLTKGTVEFELKDPNGDIRWQGKINSEKEFDEAKKFENITGQWLLTFNSIDNSGEGNLKLSFDSL